MKKGFWIVKIAGFVLLGAAAVLLFGFIVMSLWNAILVPVLNVSVIGFWQALGILVLSKILFGGFRGGGHRPGWKHDMKAKWQHMTPEERTQMKQQWRDRCGYWGHKPNPGSEAATEENIGS